MAAAAQLGEPEPEQKGTIEDLEFAGAFHADADRRQLIVHFEST